MNWFANLRISKKLMVGFGVVAALVAAIGVFASVQLDRLAKADKNLYQNMALPLVDISDSRGYLTQTRLAVSNAILADNAAGVEKALAEREKAFTTMDSIFTNYGQNLYTEKADTVNFALLTTLRDSVSKMQDVQAEFLRKGDKEQARLELSRASEGTNALAELVGTMVDLNKQWTGASAAGNTALARSASITMMVAIAIAIALAIVLGLKIASSISRPVEAVRIAADKLAKGDLNQTLTSTSKDEIGELVRAFAAMIEAQQSLAAAAGRISEGNLGTPVVARSEQDTLSHSFENLRNTILSLTGAARNLTIAANEGQLSTRAETSAFKGAFRELIEGLNGTLDAVVSPIEEAATVLDTWSKRDLRTRVTGNYKGDHARIKSAMNATADALESALEEISTSVTHMSVATEQIASGGQQLAEGSSRQAASLEEIASSLHEMSAQIRQSASNAQNARALATEAQSTAQRGVGSMKDMTDAMTSIKKSSDETARIVRTIDEIAFQTNLLALNAAVEAARAGDAGRGFAVVADEVRSLALRAAEAAKQTSALIDESGRKVGDGVRLNDEVLQRFQEIASQANKVGAVVEEIAVASGEQTQGVEQLNSAVEQINVVTQSSAANAEESAASSEELAGQAATILELVGTFQLTTSGGTPAATPRRQSGRSRPAPAFVKRPARAEARPAQGLSPDADDFAIMATDF